MEEDLRMAVNLSGTWYVRDLDVNDMKTFAEEGNTVISFDPAEIDIEDFIGEDYVEA